MIEPLGALVLLKELQEEEKSTKSGFILTPTTTLADLKRGQIIALGRGDRDREGNVHPIPLNVGDVVYFSEGNTTDVSFEGEEYKFVNWNHLFGRVNN